MTILTYLSSLLVLYQEVMMTNLTYLSIATNLVLYQAVVMTILTYLSSLIASLVSGGSDGHPYIFK